MSNKIKSNYDDNERYQLTPRGKRVKKLARTAMNVATSKAAKHAAVATTGVVMIAGGMGLAKAQQPEFHGDQIVQIGNLGDRDGTLREAAFNNVEGVDGNNINETLDHVKDDPRNADELGGEDDSVVHPGDEIHFPESVN